jgi:hypothetical protein
MTGITEVASTRAKANWMGRGIARGINQKGESGSQDRKAAQGTG